MSAPQSLAGADAAGAPFGSPHAHMFLGQNHRRNERRVWAVIALTAAMMVAEIVAGTAYGSMALMADGWHMSTHAGAMLITALAYGYARRHAQDQRFTFGTGKLGELAGFASAVVLALVALLIAWESGARLLQPRPIDFAQATAVAVAGLVVNLVSAWLLKGDHAHPHDHRPAHHDQAHGHGHGHGHDADHDHNLRAAYIHVLADALTSVLAIAALLLGRFYGWLWADPLMGVVGAAVIARWSWGLVRDAGRVLLDAPPDAGALRGEILAALAPTGDVVQDLHVWQLGPGHYAAIVSVEARAPRPPAAYKRLLAPIHELSHVTVEVQPAPV